MTAEQKLEKCKELVEKWRRVSSLFRADSERFSQQGDTEQAIGSYAAQVASTTHADELQAVLEETDE